MSKPGARPWNCRIPDIGLQLFVLTPSLLLVALAAQQLLLLPGNGDSEGTFRFANYWGEVAEIHAAKQHLQQHEGQAVIGLLGKGRGLQCKPCGAVQCSAAMPEGGRLNAVKCGKVQPPWPVACVAVLGYSHYMLLSLTTCSMLVQSNAAASPDLYCLLLSELYAASGHSKAGGEVVLYASSYDDIPLVINVAGRFWMDRGVTMRFGEDIFERAAAAPVEMPAQRDDGHTFTWLLTKEVSELADLWNAWFGTAPSHVISLKTYHARSFAAAVHRMWLLQRITGMWHADQRML